MLYGSNETKAVLIVVRISITVWSSDRREERFFISRSLHLRPITARKVVKIRKCLKCEVRVALVEFLREHIDWFAWSHEVMVGLSREVIIHRLSIDTKYCSQKE